MVEYEEALVINPSHSSSVRVLSQASWFVEMRGLGDGSNYHEGIRFSESLG
jgi:hypothetical protein